MQGDCQHEQPDSVDTFSLRPAGAGTLMFVRGKAVKAKHQQHAQAHAYHHCQRCVGTTAGNFARGIEPRQNQRERAGGEHHPGGKAEHHILAACTDFA
ncbi:hypothetical protein D3C72_2089750 [compost metagenome]